MAAEAEAAREARAKAIQASGEAKAARNLREAGETIKDSSALHLRYMQVTERICHLSDIVRVVESYCNSFLGAPLVCKSGH